MNSDGTYSLKFDIFLCYQISELRRRLAALSFSEARNADVLDRLLDEIRGDAMPDVSKVP